MELAKRIANFEKRASSQEIPAPALASAGESNIGVKLNKLNLSTRARNVLTSKGIVYSSELCQLTQAEILRIPNAGRKTLNELQALLKSLGLGFGMNRTGQGSPVSELPPQPLLPFALQIDEPSDLEGALRAHVSAAVNSERNARWVIEHLGWDGSPARTLEAIGRPEKVTRERVRQVAAKCCRKLQEREVVPDALNRALALISQSAPLTQSHLDTLMQKNGLSLKPFDVDSIRRAAKVFGLKFEYAIHDFPDALILPAELTQFLTNFVRTVKLEVGAYGCVNDEQLLEIGRRIAGRSIDLRVAHCILESEGSFALVKGCEDWWWRPSSASAGRNRLVNTIRKVLASCESVTLGELRDACRRHVRSNHIAPPTNILRAVCSSLSFLTVDSDRVARVPDALPWSDVLNPSENLLLEIFDRRGPVLDSYTVSEEGMALGLNENSLNIYKSYSPLLWRPVPGRYALVGADIPIGYIEDLERRKSHTRRSTLESGWTADHRILLARNVAENLWLSGILSVPSAIQPILQGDFLLFALGTHELGTVSVKKGNAFGFRPFLRMFGAEVGDILAVTFDPRSRRCESWLGGNELSGVVALGPDAIVKYVSKAGEAETTQ